MALFCLALLLFRVHPHIENAYIFTSKICSALAFIGLSASHLVLLMARPEGVYWLLMLTIITVSSDAGAYYIGSRLGKNKLCPSISPGKTVEGFAGGLLCAHTAACFIGHFLFPEIPLLKIALLSFILTCLGVAGDLSESIFKRCNNVKDSGTILPGHGGILDRIGSLLAAAPAMYYIIYFGLLR